VTDPRSVTPETLAAAEAKAFPRTRDTRAHADAVYAALPEEEQYPQDQAALDHMVEAIRRDERARIAAEVREETDNLGAFFWGLLVGQQRLRAAARERFAEYRAAVLAIVGETGERPTTEPFRPDYDWTSTCPHEVDERCPDGDDGCRCECHAAPMEPSDDR